MGIKIKIPKRLPIRLTHKIGRAEEVRRHRTKKPRKRRPRLPKRLTRKTDRTAENLTKEETPALEGDGVLSIEEGKIIYVLCSESSLSTDAPSEATLSINYAE